MIKFSPKFINVASNPTLIVGEKPGKTRDNSTYALTGNRTGDFVHEAINGLDNIILTNVVNLLYEGEFQPSIGLADGLIELIEIVEKYTPSKIICLGEIAKTYVNSLSCIPDNCKLVYLRHPSWINRFVHSERADYLKTLRNELIS